MKPKPISLRVELYGRASGSSLLLSSVSEIWALWHGGPYRPIERLCWFVCPTLLHAAAAAEQVAVWVAEWRRLSVWGGESQHGERKVGGSRNKPEWGRWGRRGKSPATECSFPVGVSGGHTTEVDWIYVSLVSYCEVVGHSSNLEVNNPWILVYKNLVHLSWLRLAILRNYHTNGNLVIPLVKSFYR